MCDPLTAVKDRLEGIFEIIEGCNVVVAGSAAMVLHGIDLGRRPGDIDLFLPTEDWFAIYDYYVCPPYLKNVARSSDKSLSLFTPDRGEPRRHVDPPYMIEDSEPDFPVHIFFGWRYRPNEGNWDVASMLTEPQVKNGWPVASLDVVYQQKSQARRPKDLRDMALILEHRPGEIR